MIKGAAFQPFWLALNAQGLQNVNGVTDWSYFDYSALQAHNYGLPILEVVPGCNALSCLQDLANHLVSSQSPPYLIVRVLLDDDNYAPVGMIGPYQGSAIRRMNLAGNYLPDSMYDTYSDNWIAYHQQVVKNVAEEMDKLLPGRVIAVKPGSLSGGEMFIRPMSFVNGAQVDNSTDPNASYFGDYSDEEHTNYCAWSALPSDLESRCSSSVAVPYLRNLGNFGQNFIQGVDFNSRLSVYLNQYSASHVASVIATLNEAGKEISGGNTLGSSFYGYMNAQGWNLTHSRHTALNQLEGSTGLDIVSAPYSYEDARNLGSGFLGEGVSDSAALQGKLYVHEDDTRTYFCDLDPGCSASYGYPNQAGTYLAQTISFMRRDIISSALRKTGDYILDLYKGDSFANPSDPTNTATLWQGITQVLSTAGKIDFTIQYNYAPEVAVFVDEKSPAYQPVIGQEANDNYGRAEDFYMHSLQQISKAGLAYREYLLSDLLLGNIPLGSVKLAIFLNAFNVSTEIRQAIKTKLENSGRSLVFVYAPGLMDETDQASVDKLTALTGMNIVQGAGSLNGPVNTNVPFPVSGVNLAPFGIADNGSWSPWFYVQDAAASSLGTYTNNGLSSLAYKAENGYSVLYSALPQIPAAFYRYYAGNVGVHFFTNVLGDEVEAGGNTLLVNIPNPQTRTISLPWQVHSVVEDRWGQTTTKCTNCSSFTVPSMSGPDSYVYRWN
jgi:hypothetical protein